MLKEPNFISFWEVNSWVPIYLSVYRRRVPTSFPWVPSHPFWGLLFKKANHLPGSNRIDWPEERVRPGEVARHPRWPNFSSASVQACTYIIFLPTQIVEPMSRERCIKWTWTGGRTRCLEYIYAAKTAQESSDPSHIMGPLICETGNIINVW